MENRGGWPQWLALSRLAFATEFLTESGYSSRFAGCFSASVSYLGDSGPSGQAGEFVVFRNSPPGDFPFVCGFCKPEIRLHDRTAVDN